MEVVLDLQGCLLHFLWPSAIPCALPRALIDGVQIVTPLDCGPVFVVMPPVFTDISPS